MGKRRNIRNQIICEFNKMDCTGQSKHNAKETAKALSEINGDSTYRLDGIYSDATMKAYRSASFAFGRWAKDKGYRTLDEAKPHIQEYLDIRINQGKSAYTVDLDKAAIAKLYHIKSTDIGLVTPSRRRCNIKRSRSDVVKGYCENNHIDIVNFSKSCGLRRSELQMLRKENVFWQDGILKIRVLKGKGGKNRVVPVIKGMEKYVLAITEKAKNPHDKLFKKSDIPNRFPAHKYRRWYAQTQYKLIARDTNKITEIEKYRCRGDKKSIYDRAAMLKVSQYLGHNRVDVIAGHYLD